MDLKPLPKARLFHALAALRSGTVEPEPAEPPPALRAPARDASPEPAPLIRASAAPPAGTCAKCDGAHETSECPHFPKKRERNEGAGPFRGKAPEPRARAPEPREKRGNPPPRKKPRTEASRGPAPPDGWKSQRDFVAFLRARGAACAFEAPNPKRERQCAYVASSGTYGPTTYAPTQASAGTIPRQSRGTTAT